MRMIMIIEYKISVYVTRHLIKNVQCCAIIKIHDTQNSQLVYMLRNCGMKIMRSYINAHNYFTNQFSPLFNKAR